MLKMFTTQLSGLFKRLQEQEEFALEDGARLLAQAAAGQGTIYIYGTGEMAAVHLEAVHGAEPLAGAAVFDAEKVTSADRVLMFARYSNDPEALAIAQKLSDSFIPFAAASTVVAGDEPGLEALADVHVDLKLTKGMLPDETGGRFALPSSMAALFVYYGFKFIIDEMLAEYEE
ncbi:DUF2529 domain-containing protein [Bacillus sp. FJAT-27251]|uniref:DUF2529 domain-containing protein n=1 Tax=Bacillus sp. FJAT-27251 TaxID=1684142 RepID=UPI0006A7DF36|nr:DUF2529 domain-containing protein [Bacillus sp. FJAT-27251]